MLFILKVNGHRSDGILCFLFGFFLPGLLLFCFQCQKKSSCYAASRAKARFNDILRHICNNRRVRNISIQKFQYFVPDHRQQKILLHHTAAQDNHLRREGQDGIRAKLRKVCAFQFPSRMIRRQLPGRLSPSI